MEHVLVTSVGLGEYGETTYVLDGERRETTHLSPVALARLLDVDSVFVARTSGAGEEYDDDIQVLADDGIQVRFHDIPTVENRDDVDRIINLFASEFTDRGEVRVSLDITHGYRSLPMLFFASLSYLDALNEIDVVGIYYGEYQEDAPESPLIDLTYLDTLMDWYHALRSFEQTGSLAEVARLLNEERSRLFQSGERPSDFAQFVSRINGTSRALDSGLPLESGMAARDAVRATEAVDPDEFVGPEGAVLSPLQDALEPLGLRQEATDKADIELDKGELQREAGIVRFYYEKGTYWLALECARELFINRVLYDSGPPHRDNWLDEDTRREIKHEKITSTYEEAADSDVPEPVRLWMKLSNYRNYYAHAGFKLDPSEPSVEKIERTLEELCELIGDDSFWRAIA